MFSIGIRPAVPADMPWGPGREAGIPPARERTDTPMLLRATPGVQGGGDGTTPGRQGRPGVVVRSARKGGAGAPVCRGRYPAACSTAGAAAAVVSRKAYMSPVAATE